MEELSENSIFREMKSMADAFVNDNPSGQQRQSGDLHEGYFSLQDDLVTYIESIDGVRKVNRSDQVADMLSGFNRLISYVSVAIIGLLLAVSVFLISNTVATGIAVRKEEIAIMRLIGAKNSFIKAPFLIEGVIIGLVGAALPLAVLYYLYHKIVLYVAAEFNMLTSVMKFLPVNELFSTLLPVGMLLGVGIGFFGSVCHQSVGT